MTQLIEVLKTATAADMDGVQARIAELQEELALLRDVEKILSRRLAPVAVATIAARPQESSEEHEQSIEEALEQKRQQGWCMRELTPKSKQIVRLLEKSPREKMTVADLSRMLGWSVQTTMATIGHCWALHRKNGVVSIRREAPQSSHDSDDDDEEQEQESGQSAEYAENLAREQIYELIAARGPTKPELVASHLKMPADLVTKLLNHDWFRKQEKGYAIAVSD